MKIYCVCIIGKRNNPLYIRNTQWKPEKDEDDPLKFHYIAHSSLDILNEKINNRKTSQDMFVGLLFPTEIYKIYGFVTNTKSKYLVIADENDAKEAEGKTFLQKLHELFVYEQCNPFYEIESEIKSQRFDQNVKKLIKLFRTRN